MPRVRRSTSAIALPEHGVDVRASRAGVFELTGWGEASLTRGTIGEAIPCCRTSLLDFVAAFMQVCFSVAVICRSTHELIRTSLLDFVAAFMQVCFSVAVICRSTHELIRTSLLDFVAAFMQVCFSVAVICRSTLMAAQEYLLCTLAVSIIPVGPVFISSLIYLLYVIKSDSDCGCLIV